MIESLEQLSAELNKWLQDEASSSEPIGPDIDLIDTRTVDSLQFIGLVVYIESLADIELNDEELDVDNFRTFRTIYNSCFVVKGATA